MLPHLTAYAVIKQEIQQYKHIEDKSDEHDYISTTFIAQINDTYLSLEYI